MKQSTIRDARNSLTKLVRRVENGQPLRLTRRGKPVAVLVSDRQFQRMQPGEKKARPRFSDWLKKWRANLPPDWKGVSDEEVDSWRDHSTDGGRPPFTWTE